MRLTLRTLLAWLDDTLPPGEVRQIGMQVNESQFAKELGDRIQRVTRQRRLSVPNGNGPDGTDPAIVAAYLDNELTPEAVTDFEKRCLTSDVHLAEVASVHQILSLIGQKAKVPPEARHRMYHLVKGREAVSSTTPRTFSPTPEHEPAAAPLPPWTPPELPTRSSLERFGLPAAVAALLVLLLGSAWWLAGPADETASRDLQIAANTPQAAANPAPKEEIKPEAKPEPEAAVPEDDASKKAEPPPEAAPEPKTKSSLPPGSLGVLTKSDGVLLRENTSGETRVWERLAADAAVKADERLAGLEPFRSSLKFGDTTIEILGASEVRLLAPSAGEAARFDLAQGRAVIHGGTPAAPVVVKFAGQAIKIMPPSGAVVGVERTAHRGAGVMHALPSLRVFVADGDASIATAGEAETISGPASVTLQASGKLTPKVAEPAPAWVVESTPTPVEQELGRLFGKYFSKANPVMVDLVEAVEDKQPEVRRLALSGLETIGEIDMIVPALTSPDNPPTRRGAIAMLRAYGARGPEAVKELRSHLVLLGGPDWAATVEKLLAGYTPKEATEEATYANLVNLLKVGQDVGVRELALDNLQTLTGRDSLEYDPDKPEGPGLAAWKTLQARKELTGKAKAE